MHRPVSRVIAASLSALIVTGCASTGIKSPANGHLTTESAPPTDNAGIPTPVQSALTLPKPKTAPKTETYSVVVNNIKAQELLFALARDAKLNIDIHPGINGTVTLNAIDQTLQQLLTRISKQVDMRWELDGPNLSVMPDTPFLRTYRVDYVNMARDTSGTVTVTTQIASAGAGATTGASGGSAGGGGNNSLTKIENKASAATSTPWRWVITHRVRGVATGADGVARRFIGFILLGRSSIQPRYPVLFQAPLGRPGGRETRIGPI